MAENKIMILEQIVKNQETNEDYQAITAVVEGNFKNILDYIMANDKENYTKYAQIVSDALFVGIDAILKDIQNDKKEK